MPIYTVYIAWILELCSDSQLVEPSLSLDDKLVELNLSLNG